MSWQKYTRSINGELRTTWKFIPAPSGQDGKHVSSASVDGNNTLSLTLSDGQSISAGTISTGWTSSGDNTYCNATGNVGIGVNNPTSKLDVGGELVADKLSWGSALGMWGVPHFEVAEFNDAFWKADIRYSPNATHSLCLDSSWTVTPLDVSGEPHGTYPEVTKTLSDLSRLFDGDFDTYVEFEGSDPDIADAEYTGGFNTKHVITIDNTGTTYSGAGHDGGFIYPQGAVYLTFYHISKNYDGTPTLEYQVQGSSTWAAIGAPTDVARKSINSDYVTLKWEIPASPNQHTKLRLTILANPRAVAIADRSGSSWWTDRIGVSSLNYYMDRFYTSDLEPPYVSKYTKRNTILSQIVLEDGSADDPILGFRSTLNNYSSIGNFHKGKVQAGICYNSASNAMVFTGGGAAALAIDNSQNIGIGTLNPNTLLHINGDEPGLIVQRTDNTKDSSIQFLGAANFVGAYLKHIEDESGAGGTNNDLAIGTGSTIAERMRIRGDGKIGIGTASPGKLLEVAGDLKVDGTTTINNVEYTWPEDAGSNSQVLSTDGAGNVSWATVSASGGGGSNTFVMSQAIEQANSLNTSYYYYKNVVGGYGFTNNFSPTNFSTSFPYWRVGRYASSGTIPVAANLTSYHLVGHKDGSDDDTMTLKVWKVPAPANGDAEADIPTLVEVISVEIDVDGNEMFNKNGTLTSTNSFAAGDQWMITLAPTSAYMTSDHYAHLTLVFEPS
jgi:hypothetical protein